MHLFRNLVLDIETRATDKKAFMQFVGESVKVPGNIKKPESIAKWEEETRPGLLLEAVEKTALDGAFGEICAIGWCLDNMPIQSSIADKGHRTEKVVLTEFVDWMNSAITRDDTTTLVGHNIVGFDLPFIFKRCVVHGIKLPRWFPISPRPWDKDVFDTMTKWSGRDWVSLDKLCVALDISYPDKAKGAQVPELWRESKYSLIQHHVEVDVAKTRDIAGRMMAVIS